VDRPPYVITGAAGAAHARTLLPDERVIEVPGGEADEAEPADPTSGASATIGASAPNPASAISAANAANTTDATNPVQSADDAPGSSGTVDVSAGLAQLAARGLTRVLCEGGPQLLGLLLQAAAVHELCATTAPVLVGGGPGRIVAPPPWDVTVPMHLAHLIHAPTTGTLLARWMLPDNAPTPDEGSADNHGVLWPLGATTR
jgi:hypothetical protein